MSQSLNLYRLQTLDTKIDGIKSRLKTIQLALSDDQQLNKAIKKYEKAQAESKNKRVELRQIEDKVEAQRLKRKTNQSALFSGKIKNPKELQDLEMESEALIKYITQLEDEQLDAMIAYEAAEEAEEQAKKALTQVKGSSAEENASLLGEKTRLEIELERFLREREAVIQSIPANNLNLYQDLRKKKRGSAVVAVSDGGCGICGQSLTPAEMQSIRASNQLVFCPSCERILFQAS